MIHHSYSTLYRGSVKDVLGPVQFGAVPAAIFRYTDSFSVFDWGRMPDQLKNKGQALTVLAAHWFETLEKPESWKNFSRSPEALALRKASRFGSVFNELGETLQQNGLRTHYLGVVTEEDAVEGKPVQPHPLSEMKTAPHHLLVKQVSVVKPVLATVLGRTLPDYYPTRNAPLPRLIPLEVVFRFSCPEGSSLIERARDSSYLASIGFPEAKVEPGQRWDFPVIELFTKLESADRPVSLAEALAMSGLSAAQLQEMFLRTAWVAGILRWLCAASGLELADGKLEWALSETGECFLVDAIGPDELRILFRPLSRIAAAKATAASGVKEPRKSDTTQLSKEFLRIHYRSTPWYHSVEKAKEKASATGTADWKRWVPEVPPKLPGSYLELGSQLYQALANHLTGKTWFADAWTLERAIASIQYLEDFGTPQT